MTVLSQAAPSTRLSSGYEKVDEIQRVGVRMLLVANKDHRAAVHPSHRSAIQTVANSHLCRSSFDHATYRQIGIANPLFWLLVKSFWHLQRISTTPLCLHARSSREIRDLPWLQGICTQAMPVDPSCRRGGRYSTRVFHHANLHWSAFLNSMMLPRRVCGFLALFALSADRRLPDERESYFSIRVSSPSSVPRTTDAECPRKDGDFVSAPPAHPPTHAFEGRPPRLACSRCLLVPPASSGLL
ncbi:hypothetical protein C8R44DRAFT_990721 [Mycena epipterygia]|nr:hypothetical protein C8R44DRAFT_990721 [Mycena epipterygia]